MVCSVVEVGELQLGENERDDSFFFFFFNMLSVSVSKGTNRQKNYPLYIHNWRKLNFPHQKRKFVKIIKERMIMQR